LGMVSQRLGHRPAGKWVWRCHIDLTEAQPEVWDLIHPYVEQYDGAIFTMAEYVNEDVRQPQVYTIPPAIDPLSPKNVDLSDATAQEILKRYGVDPHRRQLLQVSRFDPWKDPLGVIDVYRLVKEEIPEVQLVLVGSMAHDDPEGWDYWYKTVNYAAGDKDIFLFSNLTNVGAIEVNALQSVADVVIQKSIREGFGLVVTEALWKARPLVASRAGGIPMQVVDGGGLLVEDIPEAAVACTKILKDQAFARQMGHRGKEHVRKHYLTPRLLRDDLLLFAKLLGM
ncbi:MAG: glycosyltransferase, partial [Actinomycetota bacterium]|nr:glycosyltransferase [Actinomycetota bacterium]